MRLGKDIGDRVYGKLIRLPDAFREAHDSGSELAELSLNFLGTVDARFVVVEKEFDGAAGRQRLGQQEKLLF